jgi:hypothetical protein
MNSDAFNLLIGRLERRWASCLHRGTDPWRNERNHVPVGELPCRPFHRGYFHEDRGPGGLTAGRKAGLR